MKARTWNNIHLDAVAPMLFIAVLAASTRFLQLDAESLWVDEGWSIRVSSLPLSEIFHEMARDQHPPLHNLVLHFWMRLFGNSEFSTRALSAIFGVATVIAVYLIGLAVDNRRLGLIAGVLAALSEILIFWSQDARMYSVFTLLVALSYLFLYQVLFNAAKAHIYLAYIVVTVLACYTQYFTSMFLVSQNLFVMLMCLARRESGMRQYIMVTLSQITAVVLFSPWLYVMVDNSQLSIYASRNPPVPGLFDFARALFNYVDTIEKTTISALVSGPLLIVAVLLIANTVLRSRTRSIQGCLKWSSHIYKTIDESVAWKLMYFFFWSVAPIAVSIVVSQFTTPIYQFRPIVAAAPGMLLLVALSIHSVRSRLLRGALILVLILVSVLRIGFYWDKTHKVDHRGVSRFIQASAAIGDQVFVTPGYLARDIYNYYNNRVDLKWQPFPENDLEIALPMRVGDEEMRELMRRTKNLDRFWVVVPRATRRAEEIDSVLGGCFREENRVDAHGVVARLYIRQGVQDRL